MKHYNFLYISTVHNKSLRVRVSLKFMLIIQIRVHLTEYVDTNISVNIFFLDSFGDIHEETFVIFTLIWITRR